MTLQSTKRFRREQTDLHREIERLPVVAHELGDLSAEERIDVVETVVAFLTEILLPHADVEQRILYPEARRLLGRGGTPGDVEHDRREVRARIAELVSCDPDDVGTMQETLYALHALLAVHLERETEVYLRLVQSQPDEPVRRLFRRVAEHSPDFTPAA